MYDSESDLPLISIIVPVYNVEKYLEKCVESILAQTYTQLQIILVDDGSQDLSGQICEKYASVDKRVCVIHKENGGVAEARNVGLDVCTGELIAFIDSDDYVAHNMIQKLYEEMVCQNAEIAQCGIIRVNLQNEKVGGDALDNNAVWSVSDFWENYYGAHGLICIVQWNKLYSRKLFEHVRYEKGKLHEDDIILHKVIGQCKKIACVKDELYYYLQREDSIMGAGFTAKSIGVVEGLCVRNKWFVEHKMYLFLRKNMKFMLNNVFRIGYTCLDMSRPEERKAYLEAKEMYRKDYNSMKQRLGVNIRIQSFLFLYFERLFWRIKKRA